MHLVSFWSGRRLRRTPQKEPNHLLASELLIPLETCSGLWVRGAKPYGVVISARWGRDRALLVAGSEHRSLSMKVWERHLTDVCLRNLKCSIGLFSHVLVMSWTVKISMTMKKQKKIAGENWSDPPWISKPCLLAVFPCLQQSPCSVPAKLVWERWTAECSLASPRCCANSPCTRYFGNATEHPSARKAAELELSRVREDKSENSSSLPAEVLRGPAEMKPALILCPAVLLITQRAREPKSVHD